MKLLLDTHIWLWSLLSPELLSQRVIKELASSANELWLSPISLWELVILYQKRRLELDQEVDKWIEHKMHAVPLKEAPFTYEVARDIMHVKLPHQDPADHFIVATAKVFDLTLVTADTQLFKVNGISVLSNR